METKKFEILPAQSRIDWIGRKVKQWKYLIPNWQSVLREKGITADKSQLI